MLLLNRPGRFYKDTITPAWEAAVVTAGGTVSAAQRARVKALGRTLKGSGILAKLDRLWLLASENVYQISVDLIGRNVCSIIGGPTVTAGQGVLFNGSGSQLITTGFTPSTAGGRHSQASASFGVYTRTNIGAPGFAYSVVGSFNGTYGSTLYLRHTDGNCYWSLNGVAGTLAGPTPTAGMYIASGDTTATRLYKNGTQIYGVGSGAAGVSANEFWVGYTDAEELSLFFIGGHLTSSEVAIMTTACNAYMTSLGTNVF